MSSATQSCGFMSSKTLHELESENIQLRSLLHEREDDLRQASCALKQLEIDKRKMADQVDQQEHQIKTITQDFWSESAERERLQSKTNEQRQEIKSLKRQLDHYQVREMEDISRRRAEALQRYQDEYEEQHRQQYLQGGLGAYGVTECDDDAGQLAGHGYDTIDYKYKANTLDTSPKEAVNPEDMFVDGIERNENNSDHDSETEDVFVCPSCRKHFLVTESLDYLNHRKTCQ